MLQRCLAFVGMLALTATLWIGCTTTGSQLQGSSSSGGNDATLLKEKANIDSMINRGKQPDAIQLYRDQLSKNTEDSMYLYLYGYALKNKKEKWKQYDKCLRNDSNYYWCLVGRGSIYVLWKVYDRAEVDFKKADRLFPGQVEPLLGLADIAFAKKKDTEAIQLYQKVLQQKPDNADAKYSLALLNERQKNLNGAISWYRKLIKQKPKHFEALRSVGRLYRKTNQNAQAAEFFSRALQVRPKIFRLHIDLASLYEKLGQPGKALERYESASQLPQVHFKTYYRLGILREQTGNIDGALKAYGNARQLDKDHKDTLYRIGRLHLQKGSTKQAIPILQDAIRLDGKNTQIRQMLAKALLQQKEYADVLWQYQKILQLDPKNSNVKSAMSSLIRKLGLTERKVGGRGMRSVLKNAERIIFRCYKTRLQTKPKLRGKLVTNIRIPENSPVRVSYNLDKSDLDDELVKTCVKWTLRRCVFPQKGVQLTYTFKFKP